MPALDLRLRSSSYLFLAVVVAQLVLISAQVSTKTGMPILQAVAFGMVAEVQRAGAAATGAVGDSGPATSSCAAYEARTNGSPASWGRPGSHCSRSARSRSAAGTSSSCSTSARDSPSRRRQPT